MKVLVDTNIIIEYLGERQKASQIERILRYCIQEQSKLYISSGTLYTLAYLTERVLHNQGYTKPTLTDKQRKIFHTIIQLFNVVPIDSKNILKGVDNEDFTDLEDSFQYQCAVMSDCEVLLTINYKDFQEVASKGFVKILTPEDFIRQYVHATK
jgi:predicted nucleic acid-binding protein